MTFLVSIDNTRANFRRGRPRGGPARSCACLARSDLARRRVHLHRLLARTLAGTGIGAGALTAQRQALAVPNAPVTPEVHETLDVHGHFAPQVALDRELRDLGAERG